MIAPSVVAEVRRLLAEGKSSQRKIAQQTGVSRGSVVAIASGRRPDYETPPLSGEDEWEEPTGPPVRCPGCGGRAYTPCLLCRARKRRTEKPRRPTTEIVAPLEFDLRPEHRIRLEHVRARRRELDEAECDDRASRTEFIPFRVQDQRNEFRPQDERNEFRSTD